MKDSERKCFLKKIAMIFGIIFLILTLLGCGYVLMNHGRVNTGYAVIPGLWAMLCLGYYRSGK